MSTYLRVGGINLYRAVSRIIGCNLRFEPCCRIPVNAVVPEPSSLFLSVLLFFIFLFFFNVKLLFS